MEISSSLIPVNGHPNLYRDKETGTLINTDYSAIERAKLRKQKKIEEKQRINDLENKINSLESKLDLILKKLD